MAEEPKSTSGLFRLKDLEAISIDEAPLFPTREPTPNKGVGVVSEGAAEEMVAAIRRARTQLESTTQREPSDSHRLDELIGLARAAQAPDGDLGADIGALSRDPRAPTSVTLFPTGETRAVLEAAEAEIGRRRRRTTLLLVGAPIVLVIAAAAAVLVLLLSERPYGDETYPMAPLPAVSLVSPLGEVGLLAIPEPPPEPIAPPPEPEHRRHRDRDQERRDTVDRGSLF